jgi:Family of unknown function (DUF5372)
LVTITHPHHPLCGQQVPVVVIRRGANPAVIVRLPDGTHAAVALTSTSLAAEASAFPLAVATPPLLALNGLRQIVRFIDHLRQEGRLPSSKA